MERKAETSMPLGYYRDPFLHSLLPRRLGAPSVIRSLNNDQGFYKGTLILTNFRIYWVLPNPVTVYIKGHMNTIYNISRNINQLLQSGGGAPRTCKGPGVENVGFCVEAGMLGLEGLA